MLIKNILKGAVIGVANIIPGVSGGTMMVSMGIYDKLIHAITHIHKEFKKSMRLLIPIAIGMVLGILILARLIELMFDKIPLQTNCLFIGLIIGSLPFICKNVKGKKFKAGYAIAFILFLALVIGGALLGAKSGNSVKISHNAGFLFQLFLVGVIASATMIIPGVSGSMVLMILGFYDTILTTINACVDALIHFDIKALLDCMFVLVPFGIGVIVGIIVIAKLIDLIFQKHPTLAYWAIIGLIVASPVAIFISSGLKASDIGGIIGILASVVALILGTMAGYKLGGE